MPQPPCTLLLLLVSTPARFLSPRSGTCRWLSCCGRSAGSNLLVEISTIVLPRCCCAQHHLLTFKAAHGGVGRPSSLELSPRSKTGWVGRFPSAEKQQQAAAALVSPTSAPEEQHWRSKEHRPFSLRCGPFL